MRYASDAHRREFTFEEIQRVEVLAATLLSEVRKLLMEEKPVSIPLISFPFSTFFIHQLA